MAKRFTDSEKWADPWFMELPLLMKCLWIYLLDTCDHAGVYKVNLKLASFLLGETINPSDVKQYFDGRITELNEGTWRITKFIDFQYGALNPDNRVHASVLKTIKKEGAYEQVQGPYKGLARGLQGPKDKDKDKDKVKDSYLVNTKGTENDASYDQLEAFERVFASYPNKVGRTKALRFFCETVMAEDTTARILKAAANYKNHLTLNDWKKPKNFDTWIAEWPDWENHIETLTEKQRVQELSERLSK